MKDVVLFLQSMGEREMADEVLAAHNRLEAFAAGIDKDCVKAMKSAAEQLQAERDEHKLAAEFNFEQYQDAARLLCEVSEERDELKAQLQQQRFNNFLVTGCTHPEMFKTEADILKEERDELAAQVAVLRDVVESLWGIIDDIDSYGDLAKGDNKLYRSLVERRQRDRFSTGISTDGYELEYPESLTPPAALAALRAKHLEEAAQVCDDAANNSFTSSGVVWADKLSMEIRALINKEPT